MNSEGIFKLRLVTGLATAFVLGASLLAGSATGDVAPSGETGAPPNNETDPVPKLPPNEIEPTIKVCIGDVVPNGQVDVIDLFAVLSAWGNTGGPEDINGDGIVDARDLIELLAAWGACDG